MLNLLRKIIALSPTVSSLHLGPCRLLPDVMREERGHGGPVLEPAVMKLEKLNRCIDAVPGRNRRDASTNTCTVSYGLTAEESQRRRVNMFKSAVSPDHCDSLQPKENLVDELSESLSEHMREMFVGGTELLEGNQPRKLRDLLLKHTHLFSQSKLDIGKLLVLNTE